MAMGRNKGTLLKLLLITGIIVFSLLLLILYGQLSLLNLLFMTGLGLYFLFCLAAVVLYLNIRARKKNSIITAGEDIVIVAPHQDDCVAMAGGYAIQTLKKGGRVRILYTTDGYENDKNTRKQEGLDAWATIGIKESDIHFLKYHNFIGFLDRNEIDKCIKEIGEYLQKHEPGTIFVPLYEGAHYQHDVTNFMVSQALKDIQFKPAVYEVPIYNYFLSFKTTPEKILSGLMRFFPFITYDYPPEPVMNDPVFVLDMSKKELGLKCEMLSKFRTQNPTMLIKRLCYEDRFQKLHEYDYSKSPFDYEHSLAYRLDKMKPLPIIGKIVSKMFIWTKTIHPDPDYTMTRIPEANINK
jgi:LmbE family N-acetylglucosaminyl deacetylase